MLISEGSTMFFGMIMNDLNNLKFDFFNMQDEIFDSQFQLNY